MMNTSHRVNQLVNEVEELLAELNDEHGPEIAELRARVEQTVAATKKSLAQQAISAAKKARRYARAVDDYITGYPRIGFLTGIAVGGVIVYLANLVSTKD